MMRRAVLVMLIGLAGCSGADERMAGDGKPEQSEVVDPSLVIAPSERLPAEPVNREVSRCASKAQTIFSCRMKSGKQASVCVMGEGDAAFAQYRFGPPDASPELVWPQTRQAGQLAFKSVPYSGGGEQQISFTRDGTTYVVFSRVIRTNFAPGETNDPAIEDGILVMRSGAVLGELPCDGEVEMPIQVFAAERYLKPAAEMLYADD